MPSHNLPWMTVAAKRAGWRDHPASPGAGEAHRRRQRQPSVRPRSEAAVQFMLELAAALNGAGEPVALNQASMERIAAAYGVTDARVAVLPNMVLAAGGRGTPTALGASRTCDSSTPPPRPHGRDRRARSSEAERGAVDPEDGAAPARRDRRAAASLRHARGDRRPHGPDDRPRPDPAADAPGAGHGGRVRGPDRRAQGLDAPHADGQACCCRSPPRRSSACSRSGSSRTRRSTAPCAS